MRPVHVTGIGLFAVGYRDVDAFVNDARDASVVDAPNPWVPSRLGRGTSPLTRLLGEVAAQAAARGGLDPKTCATVYGSSLGEFETMVVLLDTIFRGDGQLSPMRFKNSVHNAASGLGSIGQGNAGFSTALAAGARSFEASMIEGIVLAAETGGDVVVSVADDRLPEPFAKLGTPSGLGVGLALRCDAPADSVLGTIVDLRATQDAAPAVTQAFGRSMAGYERNPTLSALPLLEALLSGKTGEVALAHALPRPFVVELR